MSVQSAHSLAVMLSRALIQDTRNDGSEFYKLADNSPEWMTTVIQKVHGESTPDDTIYEFIHRTAQAIADSDENSDPNDAITEMESDIYTHDLTSWLNRRIDHVYYISQALEDIGGFTDGFQLLMAAQKLQIEEIGTALISELTYQAEFYEDEESDESPE